jgi:L-asparaginase
MGVIIDEKICWNESGACALPNHSGSVSVKNLTQLPKVRIIYGYVGGDYGLFVKAALRDGARGLVYAACGNGSVPEKLTGLLKETVASGVPVVIATRCGGGIVVLSEAMTAVNGFIPAGPLNPQKAKILLQLALTKTSDVNEIQRIFASSL